ncbi:hypothetical protein BgAZ_400460 [Babesia gibsoni]|uniref:TFIIS N-terminal domain-containing protein n=1 Tax=Babesia gibsoni TaxID=33632 RepID=A0AAD8LNI8_BABGI|nr:hypothetical protein BgAZ_400460 [Babesia gibsoni]
MSSKEAKIAISTPADDTEGTGVSTATAPLLKPAPERIFSRTLTLNKINGISDDSLESLNGWYRGHWRVIHKSRCVISDDISKSMRNYFTSNPSANISAEEVESYLSAVSLLYYGLRCDNSGAGDVSKNKFFQRYYYTVRENTQALNSSIVMSNFIWACNKYTRDEFANTCLVDILLQAFPAALELFIKLEGIAYLKNTIEYLAVNKKLRSSTNYLLKALALLNKLDISFKTLQKSRIGIPINGIATAGKNVKLGIDYECENDQVKLKATDLIKKWKAIRDASQGSRVDLSARRIQKQQRLQAARSQDEQKRTADMHSEASKGLTANVNEQSQSTGSFVLNILDSMVEQREKERKRRLAMKEAQRHGLFKVTKAPDNDSGNRQEETTSVATGTQSANNAYATETPQPSVSTTSPKEQVEESRKELQSLMNFFKTFKPQTGSGQSSEPPGVPSQFPPMGVMMPPVFPPVSQTSGLTGFGIPSRNYTHMNNSPDGFMPPTQRRPASKPAHVNHGIQNGMGNGTVNSQSVPPWR